MNTTSNVNPFLTAMHVANTTTLNGLPANSSTGSNLLNMFSKSGAMRNNDEAEKVNLFAAAYKENPIYALRALFYARDSRGGQGERDFFRVCLKALAIANPGMVQSLIHLVPYYGRWDDLFVLFGTPAQAAMISFYSVAIRNGDGLACKWAPRESSSKDNKDKTEYNIWLLLVRQLGWNQKRYRKHIAEHTKVVEQTMCANKWTEINYSHVPSKAHMNYKDAFKKHDETGYELYINKVLIGDKTVKIHSGQLFPHEISAQALGQEVPTLEAMWNALPDYFGSNAKILPISDVSGSMRVTIGISKIKAVDVAIGLGLYCAERNKGPFKDHLITFADSPGFLQLKPGSLHNRVNQVLNMDWGYSTDLQAVAELIGKKAKAEHVEQKDMPEYLLIISDMQFNQATGGEVDNASDLLKRVFAKYGYKAPTIVFWNVMDYNNSPASHDTSGVMLVSGFSPSILKYIFSGFSEYKEETPYEAMMKVLNSERYNSINGITN